MPIPTNQILKLVCDLSEEENIKVAVSETIKGGLLTASATIVGGLILGPIGLATGGTLGGLSSYFMCRGKYESVPSILMKMEPSQKELLASKIRTFLQSNGILEPAKFINVLSSPILKMVLIEIACAALMAIGGFLFTKFQNRKETDAKSVNLALTESRI